ncbi:tetratricopeptide repeat protein [bacterium]|nr:tetratricopeptide repeat protein [bacterium]
MNLKETKEKVTKFLQELKPTNRYDTALKNYINELSKNPKDARIKLKIAETYFKSKKVDKAIEVYFDVAEQYLEENFLLKAISIYKNILKLNPALMEVNIKLAQLYQKLDMTTEAANQYKIVMQCHMRRQEKEKLIETCITLIEIEPSPANIRKLGEVYQAYGMIPDALEQYEKLSQIYRNNKNYDELLRVYELILAHKPDKKSMIRDVCILYLRKQEPDQAIRTMERFKVDGDEEFSDLFNKSKLMRQALRVSTPPKTA